MAREPVVNSIARLLALIELYAEHEDLALSTVSRHATGSGDTVARLQRGGDVSTRRFERAVQYLSDNWPAELPWPAHTARPDASRQSAKRGTR